MLKKHHLLAYFILAYAITWIGSLLYYFALPHNGQLPFFLNIPGTIVWYYGPCLAAIIVARVTGGKGSLRKLFSGLWNWRVGWKWYAFIVLYPLGLHLAVSYLDWWLGGSAPVFFQAEGIPEANIWLTILVLFLMQVFLRGIGEETGWRGFALPHLQSKMSPLSSSLLLGVLWALWHFHPANLSTLSSTALIFIFSDIVLTTIIYTWVYDHTKGSLLIAILFHTMLNLAEYIIPIGIFEASLSHRLLQVGLVAIVVVVLVITSGSSLGQTKSPQSEVMA